MEIPSFLKQNHDNTFYNIANKWEERAIQCNDKKEFFKSWGWATLARIPYLIDVIIDVVVAPLALIGLTFGVLIGICTLGKEAALVKYSANKFLEKINHFCLSLFGAIASPWLAHKGKDVNIMGYTIDFLESLGHEFHQKTALALHMNR